MEVYWRGFWGAQCLFKPCQASLLCDYCNWVFHQDMFLNGNLGDWYINKIYGRMILFCTLPWKSHFLCLIGGIWVKRYFPYIGLVTNLIKIIVKLWWLLIVTNWYIRVVSRVVKRHTKVEDNVKTSWNYNLVPSLPLKRKILLILTKDSLKTEIELFYRVLFQCYFFQWFCPWLSLGTGFCF